MRCVNLCRLFVLHIVLIGTCAGQRLASNQPLTIKEQEQVVSYWTNEANWHSELQLRNNLPGKELTVIPTIVSADGHEYLLKAIKLKPQTVVPIDLSAAIAANNSSLMGSYGSVVLRYRSEFRRALYAAVMVHRMGRPIAFHIDAMDVLDSNGQVGRQGIWWLPQPATQDYLILTNQGASPIPLRLEVSEGSGKKFITETSLSKRETRRLSIRTLVKQGGLTGQFGGISIVPTANGRFLDSLHIAFDEQEGFSATLKMFDYDPEVSLGERDFNGSGQWTLRAPMLALSNPDPELAFPPHTVLHPKFLLRNVTSRVQKVDCDFFWRIDETSKGFTNGPVIQLDPFETKEIQLENLPQGAAPPPTAHWSAVYLRTSAKPGEIVAVAASYDDSLRYGAQTPFIDQLSYLWKGGQFEFDGNHNSLITVGNDSDTGTMTLFTLFYTEAEQVHQYELEREIAPHDQMWVNIGELIRDRVTDRHGNVLPTNLSSGSYEFRDESHVGNGRLFEGKVIYDTSYGHVSYGCAACCGYTQARLEFNPFGLGLSGSYLNGVQILDDCNTPWTEDDADFYNWSTANSSVAQTTVQGRHTGMSPGTTTSRTSGTIQGRPNRYNCPLQQFAPSGATDVTTVASSNLKNLALGNAGSQGSITSNQVTAVGKPDGGTYSWTSDNANITLANASSSVVTTTAAAAGTSQLKVAYTVNGETATASGTINVFQPSSVAILSDTGVTATQACPQQYNGPRRVVTYQIQANQGNTTVPVDADVSISESFTKLSSPGVSCGSTPDPTQGLVTHKSFNDTFYYCSTACLPAQNNSPTGRCTLALRHVWTANGFSIFDHTLTYTCTNITPQ